MYLGGNRWGQCAESPMGLFNSALTTCLTCSADSKTRALFAGSRQFRTDPAEKQETDADGVYRYANCDKWVDGLCIKFLFFSILFNVDILSWKRWTRDYLHIYSSSILVVCYNIQKLHYTKITSCNKIVFENFHLYITTKKF